MGPSTSDEETVVLELQGLSSNEAEVTPEEISISAEDITTWNLPLILTSQTVKIQVNRHRLIQQSSYFCSLFEGNFSESTLKHLPIQWNLEIVIKVLQFIYGCPLDITSINFLPILEGALFFGVESLLLECEAWFRRASSGRGVASCQMSLDALIELWNFSLDHAIDFIPELCKGYVARNFVWAMSCNSFIDVPYHFLCACIEHPHLTIDSEKKLCEALLLWVSNNGESSQCSLESSNDCYTDILRKVRISLLPLSFVAGKRRNCYFSKFADESISSIFYLMKGKQMSPPCQIADDVFDSYRIRLTQYSERIDLSGCVQITPYFLFLSLVSSSCNMDPSLRRGVFERLIKFEHPIWNCYPVSKELLSTMSFESVQELDVSKNQWPCVDAVIKCINMSFPSLKLLKATHCLNFQMKTLCNVVQNCPQIIEIDLTVDISSVIPARVSVISASTEPYQGLENASYKMLKERMLSSNLTKLTLEGRTDINDIDLHIISGFSSSLSHLNLKGCSSVTDIGISQLVSNCMNLCSLLVSDTDFGRNSVLALCSDIPLPAHLLGLHHHHMHLSTLAFRLQQLHICGCKSVTPASLSHLMGHTYSLRSLSLRETSLLDDALYAFMGSSLEYVDVSETMVSGTALAYFIHRNPRLKVLKAMGCSNLHGYKNNAEINKCPSKILPTSNRSAEEELFHELSQTCILKEMEFGWGFSPFSLEILRPSVRTLRVVTFGLGASLGEHALAILPDICPLLEEVVLKFQVISDCILRSIMSSLRNLKVLSLCYCLGILTSLSFQIRMPNLTTLRLERVTPGMTNDDLIILTRGCSSLHDLSLIGCMLLNSDCSRIEWPLMVHNWVYKPQHANCNWMHCKLETHNASIGLECISAAHAHLKNLIQCVLYLYIDSQHIISSGWPGLRSIHLEGCGKVTCNGVSSLLECKALEDLLLRHNGQGIQRNLIEDAASKLPLLRTVSLDLCDACEGGFDTPSSANRFFLRGVKIACCKTQRCAFKLQNSTACKMVHKETIVIEWSSKEVRTTIVTERV